MKEPAPGRSRPALPSGNGKFPRADDHTRESAWGLRAGRAWLLLHSGVGGEITHTEGGKGGRIGPRDAGRMRSRCSESRKERSFRDGSECLGLRPREAGSRLSAEPVRAGGRCLQSCLTGSLPLSLGTLSPPSGPLRTPPRRFSELQTCCPVTSCPIHRGPVQP